MPVTIQKNKVKFKDPNNQGFITLDAIGSESAQEIQSKINGDVSNAIKNLNDATAAANASVDAIAQAVRAVVAQGTDTTLTLTGVPADAKATGDSIVDLKSASEQNSTGIIILESGTFDDNDGVTKTTGNHRMRNKYPLSVRNVIEIKMPSGYNIWWFAFDKNLTLLSATTGWNNSILISALPIGTVYVNFSIRNQSTPSASADISSQIETVQDGIVLTYIADTALAIADDVKKSYSNYVNLFNPSAIHDGIHSQTNGAGYGTYTASTDYCYTDLIPLDGIDKLHVFNNFLGNSTIYITYFSALMKVIGKDNGYNPIITSFPENAAYFCVTVAKNYLQTCMIYPEYYAEYIPFGERIDKIYGYAKYKHRRLDRVFFMDYSGNSVNAGKRPFPYKATTGVYISALIAVPESGVSYRKAESFTPRVYYTTSSGAIISYEDCAGTAGTLTIPGTAAYLYYVAGSNNGTRDPETAFCLVEGIVPPSSICTFDDIEIDGLDVDGTDYLSGKNIVFDGDSITEGAGVTDISTGIAPNNNKGWAYWIQRNHPLSNCYGYGKSGWTVGKVEGQTDSLLNHIPLYPQNVDLFVLSGGYNDQAQQMAMGELVRVTDGASAYYNATFDQYTFFGALEYWFQQLRITYPTAQIVYVLTPKRIYTTNPVFNNDTKGVRVRDVLYSTGYERMNKFWEAIKAVCDKWAIRYIDLSDVSGVVGTGEITDAGLTVNSRYFQITNDIPDMTHPNTLYYKTFIVPQIEALIKAVID